MTDPSAELLELGAATLGESGATPMDPGIAAIWTGATVAGPAFVAACGAADNLALHVAAAEAPPGSVLCVGFDAPADRGYWGEVLTTGAQARGLVGLVIDGGVRDADALERLAFPVFARGLVLRGATKTRSGAVGGTTDVGGVAVSTGDWIVGDRDGVVVIPHDQLGDVLGAGHERAAKEAAMFTALRSGSTTVQLLDLDTTAVTRPTRPSGLAGRDDGTRSDRPPPTLDIYVGTMQTDGSAFRMGRLDHVHIRVPDRAEAARWYAEHLGFEPVDAYAFWATGFEGGPLQISADGGQTMLALFEASDAHPMVPQQTGIAFSVDADSFMSFARSLPCGIDNPRGERLALTDLVDFDMCWAFELVDPWGNQYELNCYDHDRIRAELVEPDAVEVVRYWPPELYTAHRNAVAAPQPPSVTPTT